MGFERGEGRSTPEPEELGQGLREHFLFCELLAALAAAVFLAQEPPRNTARAIRIFRGIMIAERKHICPQKSLIFPAVTNQLAGGRGSPRHQEPKLKRKKMQKVKADFRQVNLSRVCGARHCLPGTSASLPQLATCVSRQSFHTDMPHSGQVRGTRHRRRPPAPSRLQN